MLLHSRSIPALPGSSECQFAPHYNIPNHTATHHTTLQFTRRNTALLGPLECHFAPHCNTLQLQETATHCNVPDAIPLSLDHLRAILQRMGPHSWFTTTHEIITAWKSFPHPGYACATSAGGNSQKSALLLLFILNWVSIFFLWVVHWVLGWHWSIAILCKRASLQSYIYNLYIYWYIYVRVHRFGWYNVLKVSSLLDVLYKRTITLTLEIYMSSWLVCMSW